MFDERFGHHGEEDDAPAYNLDDLSDDDADGNALYGAEDYNDDDDNDAYGAADANVIDEDDE